MKYFHFYISNNPLRTWWKARKYFKFPKLSIKIFKSKYTAPYVWLENVGKILDICIHDVWWKDKYDTPRHERNPIIWIILFRKYHFRVIFHMNYLTEDCSYKDCSMEYWEYMLNYLHYSHSLKVDRFWRTDSKIFKYEVYIDEENYKLEPYTLIIMPQLFSLNKKGRKLFNSYYNEVRTT